MDYQQQEQARAIAYLELLQTSAWQYLKQYLKEQEEVVIKRFLNGDEIKEQERFALVGLIKLFNHIEDGAKRVKPNPE
ncbi:MAG: hypothetical protein IPG26_06615 [Coprothermobacter sp.]|nr:hypothetical protein [Coprothermobacter sp.]